MSRMRRHLIGFAALAVTGGTTSLSNAELVFNGGFETGNFAGWQVPPSVPNQSLFIVSILGGAHTGSYYGVMASTQMQYISQILPTEAGTDYELSFWLRQPVNAPSSFRVRWEGGSVFGGFMALPTPNDWYHFTVPLHANITGSFLEFGQGGTFPLEWHIDDISVVVIPAPPAAAPLLAAAGLLALKRRRRAAPCPG